MDDRRKHSLEQTAESLKLLGAGSAYKAPDTPNKFMDDDAGIKTWSHATGPWQQRHPQGQWK